MLVCLSSLHTFYLNKCPHKNNNFTFDADQGGFSEDNLLSIDQRGFKAFIQEEGKEFLTPDQVFLSSIVKTVSWSADGVSVTLNNGTDITGDYAICTFSLGVLQNDDVRFSPSLPGMCPQAGRIAADVDSH